MTTVTRWQECTVVDGGVLYLALELGSTKWKLAFAVGLGHRPRIRQVPAGALDSILAEIAMAKTHLGLPAGAPVRSCYEAGRDGFWLHRALCAHGVANTVVDPSSITVPRRKRRAKSDRIDATALVIQLIHAAAGDRRSWRAVHVPLVQAEADRQLSREWDATNQDRTRLRNRIQGLLATQGVRLQFTPHFVQQLQTVQLWDGSLLAPEFIARIERDWTQLQALEQRRRAIQQARRIRVMSGTDRMAEQTRKLAGLRGIAMNGAVTLTTEFFAWRAFTNGRQIAACAGLAPTPYRSDQQVWEQGIGQSGNARVRALSVELAWRWLRWQPSSALSRWFHARFGHHQRSRRVGIIALARKLLIAWWRYVEYDILPEGAVMSA